MADFDLNNMNDIQYDVLREIGNIGAGNATTALAQMINTRVDMKVPVVSLLDFKDLPDIIGGAETLVAGILLTLSGEINGMMMFVLEKASAHRLVDLLMGTESDPSEEFNEMEISALAEIGNIISGAYLYSVSAMTNLFVKPSVPYTSIDMAGAILSVPAIEFGKVGDKALFIKTQFGEGVNEINGYFILVPTLESYGKILESLGFI